MVPCWEADELQGTDAASTSVEESKEDGLGTCGVPVGEREEEPVQLRSQPEVALYSSHQLLLERLPAS